MYENINLKTLYIELTDRCNLCCKHCFNRPFTENNDMSMVQLKYILDIAKNYFAKNENYKQKIVLTGGEVLLHPEIREIILLCKEYADMQFILTTNGLLITKEIINLIEDSSNIGVQISVDGVSKAIYEKQRGTDTFDSFLNGFNLIKDSKINLKTTRTCITQYNYQYVDEICEYTTTKGFIPSFIFVLELGNGKTNKSDLELTVAQKIISMNKISAFNKRYGRKIRMPEITTACTFTLNMEIEGLFIKPNGDIAPCQMFYDETIGNIFADKIRHILCYDRFEKYYKLAQKRKEQLSATSKCKNCVVLDKCGMGCMGMSNSNGNILDYDGQCESRKKAFLGHLCDLI